MRMPFENGSEDIQASDLKDMLGWWDHSGNSDTSALVGAVMILCTQVAKLESRIAELEKEKSCQT